MDRETFVFSLHFQVFLSCRIAVFYFFIFISPLFIYHIIFMAMFRSFSPARSHAAAALFSFV